MLREYLLGMAYTARACVAGAGTADGGAFGLGGPRASPQPGSKAEKKLNAPTTPGTRCCCVVAAIGEIMMATSTTKFRMKIAQVFRLGGGRTVLVGPVEGPESLVHSCTCELLVNGVRRQVLRIEGEMMSGPRHELGYRVVSSKDKVNMDPQEAETQECLLLEIGSQGE